MDQLAGCALLHILQPKYDPATVASNAGIPIPIPTPRAISSLSPKPLDVGAVGAVSNVFV